MYKGHALLCIFNVFITYLGKKKTLKDIAETFVLRKSKKKFFITDNESKSIGTCNSIQTKSESRKKPISLPL